MNELKIINTIPATIKWDKEVAIKEANEIMAKYEGVEFTEEQLPIAKKEVATLRKVSKEINAQALKIDKELTASVKEFRTEVKEVKAIVDNGINFINEQVQVFEARIQADRKMDIMAFPEYIAIKDYGEFMESWLLKKWTDEMLVAEFEALDEVNKSHINTIKMMCTSHNIDSSKYVELLKTQSLETVLERVTEASVIIAEVKKEEPIVVEVDKDERVVTITRQLTGTISSIKILKAYALQLGIEWVE